MKTRLHSLLLILAVWLSACGSPTPTEDATVYIWGRNRVLPVRLTNGLVEIRSSSNSDFEAISANQSLSSGDEIQTGHDGQVIFALPYGALIMLDTNTHFKIISLESEDNKDVLKLYLMAGQVFFIDEWTQPPNTLDGLATSPAITFDIETDDGQFILNLPALMKVRGAARLVSFSFDPDTGDINATCFAGKCSLSYGGEQTNIPEGEIALVKKMDKSSPKLFFKKWSRDNGSIVSALAFAGIDPVRFEVLGWETSPYATVHKVDGLVEAGLDTDHAAVTGGELLVDGHSLHTNADSKAVLHLADGSVLTVGEHSTVHLTHDTDATETPKGHFLLESGELYLINTGNHTAEEWVIDLADGVAIVAQSNPQNLHIGLHVSYDPASDVIAVTLLDGQAVLTAGDQAVELPIGKRSEVKDSHDRYANIETNLSIGDMDESENEAWQSTLIFSEVELESFEILESH